MVRVESCTYMEGEAREARRLLYALDAVIALHLTAEEELLSQVEDLAL